MASAPKVVPAFPHECNWAPAMLLDAVCDEDGRLCMASLLPLTLGCRNSYQSYHVLCIDDDRRGIPAPWGRILLAGLFTAVVNGSVNGGVAPPLIAAATAGNLPAADLQGFIHSKWCRISSINSRTHPFFWC